MSPPSLRWLLPLLFLPPLVSYAQNFLPLDFSHNVQATNAWYPNNSTLGPEYYSGQTLDFTAVTTQNGQVIDARVTVLGSTAGYEFVGYIPDYNGEAGQPENDLGVYYRHNGDPLSATGGIAYTISFFVGGSAFTDAAVLSDFRILIYDHDGEPGQSESIRTYEADGFTGYQLHNGSGIQTQEEAGIWRFDAVGQNLSESSPEGGFIAYYQNTSTIRFDMFSTTFPETPPGHNGIFAGFDGDLSLTNGQTSDFGAFVPIPEPASFPLATVAALMALLRRKRHSQ